MTSFYGFPNAGEFWHWPTLVHFFLVALAGGSAFLAGLSALEGERRAPRLALFALGLILLDLFVLWAESPARFRLTHLWLFLTFRPLSAISWGSWGLALSLVLAALLALGRGPHRVVAGLLMATATVVLVYPGLLLAENPGRALWSDFLIALMPITGLALAVGLGLLFLRGAPARLARPVFLTAALAAALYPFGLYYSGAAAREALAGLGHEAGLFYLAGGLLLLLAGFTPRRPEFAGTLAILGATVLRSLLVLLGQ